MNLRWFKGNTKSPKSLILREQLKVSRPVLIRFREILNEELESSRRNMLKEEAYSNDWPYYMADKVGEQRALTNVINLLKVIDNE